MKEQSYQITHQTCHRRLEDLEFPIASYHWQGHNSANKVSLHWHDEVEILKFSKGSFKLNIDMVDFNIDKPCILLIPANVLHSMILPKDGIERALMFSTQMLNFKDPDSVQNQVIDTLSSGNMKVPSPIYETDECYKSICKLVDYICEKTDINNPVSLDTYEKLFLKAKILELLSIFYKDGYIQKNVKAKAKSKEQRLKEILLYINDHYTQNISISDMASLMNVTEQYFCRYFKNFLGISFTEYVNEIKVRKAARDLVFTNMSVCEIAQKHGFANTGYFFKNFKKKFSMTPAQYRKEQISWQE